MREYLVSEAESLAAARDRLHAFHRRTGQFQRGEIDAERMPDRTFQCRGNAERANRIRAARARGHDGLRGQLPVRAIC